MKLASKDINGVRVVQVAEARIDAAGAIRFKEDMRSAVDGVTGRVVLDLSRVDFVDSSGLGAIVASMKQMPEGQDLDLAGLNPSVDRVFRLTRMETVFRIHASVDDAITLAAE